LVRALRVSVAALTAAISFGAPAAQGSSAEVLRVWPAQPPGTVSWTGPEETADAELPNLGKVHIITNVIVPTLTVLRPAPGQSNGTAMMVVPGGAFRALPWDLDGIETARWLTGIGITAFILKYRVRPPEAGTRPDQSFQDFARRTQRARDIAVADAQQAMRLIRSKAKHYDIAADRIGMIGFSAGAMTTAIVADASDSSVRPNFAASLYGALLTPSGPSANAAPLFIVAAQDDKEAPPTMSVEIFARWTKAMRPAELHLYERGGHGFAFRPHQTTADTWPAAFQAWLDTRGYLKQARR
jgi:dienelactone hydrolase